MLGANPSLYALFGQAYLAITFDYAVTGQRYQGIVPLDGDSLAQACESYFAQSEQVPTLIRTAVQWNGRECLAAAALALLLLVVSALAGRAAMADDRQSMAPAE